MLTRVLKSVCTRPSAKPKQTPLPDIRTYDTYCVFRRRFHGRRYQFIRGRYDEDAAFVQHGPGIFQKLLPLIKVLQRLKTGDHIIAVVLELLSIMDDERNPVAPVMVFRELDGFFRNIHAGNRGCSTCSQQVTAIACAAGNIQNRFSFCIGTGKGISLHMLSFEKSRSRTWHESFSRKIHEVMISL